MSTPLVPTLAVIGGGASGSIAAIHTIRSWAARGPLRIVMYDAKGTPGRGVAYGTDERCHLLNVPAARMSALADQPDHFLEWLSARDPSATPWTFAPRMTYGDYLTETLLAHVPTVDFVVRQRSATDIVRTPRGLQVRSGHEADHVDAVVLATGNLPPAPLVIDGAEVAPGPRYLPDPWEPGALRRARELTGAGGSVLLVGTGLTSVDVALSLTDGRPGGAQVVCVSRNGLLPRRHTSLLPEPWPVAVPDGDDALSVRDLQTFVQQEVAAAQVAGTNWRSVIDGLRPHVSTLWQRLPIAERRRFLAGPSRLWDVHRHRMAPAVAAVVAELMRRGCLQVRAARLTALREHPNGYDVTLQHTTGSETFTADVVVNCTGPAVAGAQGSDQLLTRLVARGLAQYDALGIGICTDADGRVVDGHGAAKTGLFAIGPLRRGELWESTAVPEIRQQAALMGTRLAEALSAPTLRPVGHTVGVAD